VARDAVAVAALRPSRSGRREGPPGLRPQYRIHYYGANFRDPNGYKDLRGLSHGRGRVV